MAVDKAVEAAKAVKAANSEKTTTRRRGKGRPFQPGQSGNPSGRPKIPEDIRIAFREAVPEALETLKKIVASPTAKDADKIRAAEVILDRSYGKAPQSMEIEAKSMPPVIILGGDDIPD